MSDGSVVRSAAVHLGDGYAVGGVSHAGPSLAHAAFVLGQPLFRNDEDGAPQPARALGVVPPGYAGIENPGAVHVLQLDSSLGVCAPGTCACSARACAAAWSRLTFVCAQSSFTSAPAWMLAWTASRYADARCAA